MYNNLNFKSITYWMGAYRSRRANNSPSDVAWLTNTLQNQHRVSQHHETGAFLTLHLPLRLNTGTVLSLTVGVQEVRDVPLVGEVCAQLQAPNTGWTGGRPDSSATSAAAAARAVAAAAALVSAVRRCAPDTAG